MAAHRWTARRLTSTLSLLMRLPIALSLCAVAACAARPASSNSQANAAIDSLNTRVIAAYRTHDPKAYAALWTDTAVFEWPAFNTVRGPAGMAEMARNNWATLRDMDLRLDVASRRLSGDNATEFGAFQQAYTDSAGARFVEYGRYVSYLLRQSDGRWLMDRFFAFEDSTRKR
jgi:ketosteroid isomerase-like protein